MAWTTPRTWTNGEVVDAAMLNTHVRDNLNYLKTQVAAHFLLSGASLAPSIVAPCAFPTQIEMTTNNQNIVVPAFGATATEAGEWTLAYLPDDYDGGIITARAVWTANSTSTNAVVWSFDARAYADNDSLDQAWGAGVSVTDANGSSAYMVRISDASAAITIGGTPAAGQLLQFRIKRLGANAADTLAVDAYLLGVIITYTRA